MGFSSFSPSRNVLNVVTSVNIHVLDVVCHYFLCTYALYLVLISTLLSNYVHFNAFPCSRVGCYQFSSFPANWKILNVTAHVNIHAFDGMHHNCTFAAVVSCSRVNGSLLRCFSMIFFNMEKSAQDRIMLGSLRVHSEIGSSRPGHAQGGLVAFGN